MEATPGRLDRRATKERTRERLLDAAASVFARTGIEGASLDEVAEAAGYTKGAIYSNFASKTELVLALLERRIRQQAEAAEAALEGMTLEQGLQALDEEAARAGGIDREWIVLVVEFWLLAMRDERARAAMAGQYERARGLEAAMIARKYEEAGEAPPLPPRELAIIIEGLGLGIALQSLLDPETVSIGLQAKAAGLVLGAGRASEGAQAIIPRSEAEESERAEPRPDRDQCARVGSRRRPSPASGQAGRGRSLSPTRRSRRGGPAAT